VASECVTGINADDGSNVALSYVAYSIANCAEKSAIDQRWRAIAEKMGGLEKVIH